MTNKYEVGSQVFICDGGEHHGKRATITKVYPHDEERYDAVLGNEKKDCGVMCPLREGVGE